MLYVKHKILTFMIAATFLSTSTKSAFTRGVFARNIPSVSTTATNSALSMSTSNTTSNGAAAAAAAKDGACSPLVPDITEKNKALLKEHNIGIEPITPVGARVTGLDLRKVQSKDKPPEVWEALEFEMAQRGYFVFPDQGVMSPDEQIHASCLWGGKKMHSTHGVHPATPEGNRHIFRLSNDPNHGILGVGPQWHNDGSFTEGTFSHVGYHIVRVPENGGGTFFGHQGAAFDMLPPEKQEQWQRLASLNSNSMHLHPLVHEHPISGRKSVWLHLGMTGAVIERLPDGQTTTTKNGEVPYRLLNEEEMKELFNTYNNLLNDGEEKGYTINYQYNEGDLIIIDNLAVGHKAAPEAHQDAKQQGLRILHRTTVQATQNLEPGLGLPQAAGFYGPHYFGPGVWIEGGIGFRWDDKIRYQN